MSMEELLARLFDFQKFEKEPALQSVIDEVEARYFCAELSDDELCMLSAAGDPLSQPPDPKESDLKT
jgi:hypothetical protein